MLKLDWEMKCEVIEWFIPFKNGVTIEEDALSGLSISVAGFVIARYVLVRSQRGTGCRPTS